MSEECVLLRRAAPPDAMVVEITARARSVVERPDHLGRGPDLQGAFELARSIGGDLPLPGTGRTAELWEGLASLGAVDLVLARVLEPHLDALAILGEAQRTGHPVEQTWTEDALWGVYAAEGPEGRLRAECSGDGWVLDGPKPWCSLAEHLTRALVTAWVDEEHRGLFVVDLDDPGVRLRPEQQQPWVSRGLTAVRSTGLELHGVPAQACGPPGWYLQRPGFAWGGVGVAAIWFGAAVSLARRLRQQSTRREPDQVALLQLGAVDAALARARAVLLDAAAEADAGATGTAAHLSAARARQVVADTATEVLDRVGRALGPGPLTSEEEHARRVADLSVYLRQHHAERDQVRLGAHVAACGEADGAWRWW